MNVQGRNMKLRKNVEVLVVSTVLFNSRHLLHFNIQRDTFKRVYYLLIYSMEQNPSYDIGM
jgi:hypothetical protein